MENLTHWVDGIMAGLFLLVLVGATILTVKSRGIQFRGLGQMARLLWRKPPKGAASGQVDARKALFTAMSTTIGIGNIVGPIVAMGFGGPGALVCYVIASLVGAAATYAEVSLAMRYRHAHADGSWRGGPMPYLKAGLSPGLAKAYAACGCILLLAWSTNQSNTLGGLLLPHGVQAGYTGLFLAVTVMAVLLGGIERVGKLNERMVPFMFILYTGACLWILGQHIDALPSTLRLVCSSFFKPRALVGGVGVHATVDMLRWGLARAVQANEAGVGTSTIPHSMSHGHTPQQQGLLAMASVYSNGLLCVLTGLTVLVTGAWQAPDAVFDVTLLANIFVDHFPLVGAWPLGVCAFLFAFGTIIGNCYNGSQCFLYLTRAKHLIWYQAAAGLAVFVGALANLRLVWSFCDFLLVPVVLINIMAVVLLVWRGKVSFDAQMGTATASAADL